MMTGVIAKLLLDTVIIVLLALTIAYCWLLNRRIKVLQNSKSELAQLLKYFDESTQRASESIIALQTASKKIGENIQNRIDKANYIMDDLTFLIEKSNKVADQMEASFAVNRARSRVAAEQLDSDELPQPRKAPVAANDVAQPAPRKEAPVSAPAATASRERPTASLGAVLEKMAGRNPKPVANGNGDLARKNTASRSKAEQELLDMLRSGMKG